MASNKSTYYQKMNALADSINAKAASSGRKDLDALKVAVDSIVPGIDTSDATAYDSDILFGKTAYARGAKLFGSILSKQTAQYTPSTQLQTISAGQYLAGDQIIAGDANLVPENIADGVTIFGVTGTHSGGGISGGYNVTFKVDDADYTVISVPAGESIAAPLPPTKTGYDFVAWTIGGGTTITFPYTPLTDTTMYAEFSQAKHVTISSLGSQSPSSVTFDDYNSFPTSFEEWTDANNNVFIKIPTMYRKVNTVVSNQITSFTISTAKEDNDYEPYPVFIDENNNILPYICIGKYCLNNTTTAQSTVSGSATMNINQARTLCSNVGVGYQQYDIHFHKLFQDLALAISKLVDFQSTTTAITNYLGVYDLDKRPWTDGIGWTSDAGGVYVCYAPSKYSNISNAASVTAYYDNIGYNLSEGYEVKTLGYNTNHPFINYPSAVVGNTNMNTYYCDKFIRNVTQYGSGTSFCASVGGASKDNGLWHGYVYSTSTALNARLCYKPIS